MKQKMHAFLINPVVIIVPFVFLLSLGWRHYISASHHFNVPTHNILSNAQFNTTGSTYMPEGWQLEVDGAMGDTISRASGHVGGHALTVAIRDYKSGDATILSPIVNVTDNTTYLYKAYYTAKSPFDMLVRRYYQDGTSVLSYAQHYSKTSGSTWSTTSTAFKSDVGLSAVQIVYRLTSSGSLTLSDTYMESRDADLSVSTPPVGGQNLLNNVAFDTNIQKINTAWTPFSVGDNTASLTYSRMPDQDSYAHITIQNYKSGEAKWQYPYITVHGGQRFRLDYTYRSDTHPEVIAEFIMNSGERQFESISKLTPAADWTAMDHTFEVPPGAKQMLVVPILKSNGYLDAHDYALEDISKPGAPFFQRPLISLTFDDGWHSTYTNGVPLMNKVGMKGTFYVSLLTLDTPMYITSANILALHKAGNEIASHSTEHTDLTTLDRVQVNTELKAAADYIHTELGIKKTDFATPNGEDDAEVLAQAKRYYESNRGIKNGINTRQNFDTYNLRTLVVDKTTSPQELSQAIAHAKANNAWLILTYRQIKDGKSRDLVTPANFKKQLDAVKASGIPVVTVRSALQELAPQL